MHSISVIQDEHLYKMIFYIRKTFPNNDNVYIIFFITKFIPLLLFTHANYSVTNSLFSITTILNKITILQNFKDFDYTYLCIILYIIILYIIFSLLFIYIYFKKHCQKIYKKDTIVSSEHFHISKSVEKFINITFIVVFIVLLLYQHITEVFYYGIVSVIFSYLNSNNFVSEYSFNNVSTIHYILFGFNIIFFILIYILLYNFIRIASKATLKRNFGFQSSLSPLTISIYCILFSLQGVYSTLYFFTEDKRNTILIVIVYCIEVIFFLHLCMYLKRVNYYKISKVDIFFRYSTTFIVSSGLNEILFFHFGRDNSSSIYFFYTLSLLIDIANTFFITRYIDRVHSKKFIKNFARDFFDSSKLPKFFYLFQFCLTMKNLSTLHEKAFFLYQVLDSHHNQCTNQETCICFKYKEKFMKSLTKNDYEERLKQFNKYCEMIIIDTILTQNSISRILLFHCDYLISVKKVNAMNIQYICNYYLIKKRKTMSFNDAYLLYELKTILYEKYLKQERISKKIKLFDEKGVYQKVKSYMNTICSCIENLLHYKNTINKNSSAVFRYEDILKQAEELYNSRKYFCEHLDKIFNGKLLKHYKELRIMILFFIKLLEIKLPKDTALKLYEQSEKAPEYEEILQKIIDVKTGSSKQKFLILLLNADNKFIVDYISLELAEQLHLSIDKLIGMDFHEALFPQELSNYHEKYMKTFFLFGNKTYTKESFLLNISRNLVPFKIICKVFPTLNGLFGIIVKCEDSLHLDIPHNYIGLLNSSYVAICLCSIFEKKFSISQKIAKTLKIDFTEFFGLNKEHLDNAFKEYISSFYSKTSKLKNKKLDFPAPTTMKKTEMYQYGNINLLYFNEDYKPETYKKTLVIEKGKVYIAIHRYGKKVEAITQDKDWKFKMNDPIQGLNQSLPIVECYDLESSGAVFSFNFTIKTIGNVLYYLLDIQEHRYRDSIKPSTNNHLNPIQGILSDTAWKSQKNLSQYHSLVSFFNSAIHPMISKYDSTESRDKNSDLTPTSNAVTPTGVQLDTELSTFNRSLNRSINNSECSLNTTSQNKFDSRNLSTLFLMQNKTTNPGQLFSQIKSTDTMKEKKNTTPIIIITNKLIIVLLFAICILCITNFSYIIISNKVSLKLFQANAYVFLLANDIYFGSIATIHSCLIKENIQEGDIERVSYLVQESAKHMVDHFYKMRNYTNQIIHEKGSGYIYKIFNSINTFKYILSNLERQERNASMVEEIYSISSYFRNFDIINGKCRLKRIFFDKLFESIDQMEFDKASLKTATKEEKLIYYIITNVISTYSNKIENLMKECYDLLNHYNKSDKNFSLSLNVTVLIISIVSFFMMLYCILSMTMILKEKIMNLFIKKENENLFLGDVERFKSILNSFSLDSCLEYSYYKLGFGDNSHKTMQDVNDSLKGISKDVKERKKLLKKIHPIKRSKRHSLKNGLKKDKKGNNSIEEDKAYDSTKIIRRAKPKFAFISLIIVIVVFLIYFIYQIVTLSFTLKSYNKLIIENDFGTNILSRNPKINELILYTMISVLANDIEYIKREPEEYDQYILSNYFKKKLDLSSNSIFLSFDKSNYIYLYYQIFIIKANINSFANSKMTKNYLSETSKNEVYFESKDNFCIYLYTEYFSNFYGYRIKHVNEFFSYLSNTSRKCRFIGQGLNLNGFRSSLDLVLQQLTNNYDTFKKGERDKRQAKFFKSPDILMIQENAINVYQYLHYVDCSTVIKDISHSYHFHKRTLLIFSLLSIVFSLCIISSLYFMISVKFKHKIEYLQVIMDILTRVDQMNRIL